MLALIFYSGVIILSASYPFSILKIIKYGGIGDYIKIFSLLHNPNLFIILNNGIFLMQVYNKNNFELISSRRGLFGHQILEINSNIILMNYLSKEEEIYLMIVVNIHSLKVLDCISHKLTDDITGTFKSEKNPKFYSYSNQIEYIAIHYPKFLQNNYFIKNDVQVKKFHGPITNLAILKNDIFAVLSNKQLIIESKNINIHNVDCFSLIDENDIIICFSCESKSRHSIKKLNVIKLKENGYEIINTNSVNSSPENIVKISRNRFIIYYNETNNIDLWKLKEDCTLEYLSKTKLLKEYSKYNSLEDIFVLNKDIIIPKFKSEFKNFYLYFWKINEDNTLTNVINIDLGEKFESLLQYDNILFIQYYNSIALMNLNNYQIIKQIENLEGMSCMTKSLNGNILLGIKGEIGCDIVEYKFNKTTYDLTKLKFINNAYYTDISKIIEMENGNIVVYQNLSDCIIIWNRKEDLK